MAISNDPRPVLRQELDRVFKNQRVVRAFEKIFDLIPPEFINQQEQIDALVADIEEINSEFSQLASVSDLRAEVDVVRQQLDAIQQGPNI